MAKTITPVAVAVAAIPAPSALVPRRAPGTSGRRSPMFPELNYQVISQQLGISATYLGRILSGRNRPSMELAARLAALMGWSLDQINALHVRFIASGNKKAVAKNSKGVVCRESKPLLQKKKHKH